MKSIVSISCVCILGCLAFSKPLSAIAISTKTELSSIYPALSISHNHNPHIYGASAVLSRKGELLPYAHYSQDNSYIEAGLGSLVDYTFENKLFNRAFFNSGLYLKSTIKPMTMKYFALPKIQYASVTVFQNYGASALSETEGAKERTTFGIFASKSFPLADLHGSAYVVTNKPNSESSATGYWVGASSTFNTKNLKHKVSLDKIAWQYSGTASNHFEYKEIDQPSYFSPFFESLSRLRDQSSDTLYPGYVMETDINKLHLKLELRKIFTPDIGFASLSVQTQIDKHIGVFGSVYKSSNDPGVSVRMGLVIIHKVKI